MIDPAVLEPGIRAWLAAVAAADAAAEQVDPLDLPARRRREFEISESVAAACAGPVDPHALMDDTTIADLAVRRFRPPVEQGALLPTQVYLHGGGFVSGSAFETMNAVVLAERAVAANLQIIAVEYRLAPEHPYPAAVEDTVAVLRSLAEDPTWQADPDRLGVGGASAGGHIAAVASLRLRNGGPTLRHALLEIPALDLTADWPSVAEYASAGEIDGAALISALYLSDERAVDDFARPVRTADLSGLPRTAVMTAQFDPLRDAAEAYANRVQDAGGQVWLRRGDGQLHGTQGLMSTVATSRAWQDAAIEELRRGLPNLG